VSLERADKTKIIPACPKIRELLRIYWLRELTSINNRRVQIEQRLQQLKPQD
jgi:hypothetical protein